MEDAPMSFTSAVVFSIIFFIVIPLVLAYRRGYFINIGENFECVRDLFPKVNSNLPKEWTITKVRQLTAFEKSQIEKISVELEVISLSAVALIDITLKSGKHISYKLGDKSTYSYGDMIDKNKVLIRTWQKQGAKSKYDMVPFE